MTDLQRLLKLHEGEKLSMYKCTNGKWTIGIGHNLEDRGITKEISRFIFDSDVSEVHNALKRELPFYTSLSPVRRSILIDMAFNLGVRGLIDGWPSMMRALVVGNWKLAAFEMGHTKSGNVNKWVRDVKTRAHRLITMMETDEWPPELADVEF